MTHLRSRLFPTLLSSLTLLGALACTEKKVEPPKPAVEAPKPPPPAPPKVEEPRADAECAAGLEPGPAVDAKVGDHAAKSAGYKLTIDGVGSASALSLGVLGPVNEDSGQNMLALKKYLKFFQDEKVDAIVVTGDIGEVADGIGRVLNVVAEAKLPVLVIIGNRECRADYSDGVAAAQKNSTNIINLNKYRVVELGALSIVSLPGYHEPNYINCATGCRYYKSTVDDAVRAAKDSKVPVVLVAHGPPHGAGNAALDYVSGGENVGDKQIDQAIADGKIRFGLFSNIKEAGGRAAADPEGTTLVKENTPSDTLYLNPGPADTVGWEMNDGTRSNGMAGVFTFKDGKGSFKIYRAKAMTAAEKAEAKKLDPPKREEKASPAK